MPGRKERGKMYRVLLADDEPLILAGLKRKIDWNALGFEIAGECTDGRALLEQISTLHPDLLVLDIQMPHMTGLQVLNAIYRIADIPSIVISGFSDFAYAQEALRYGVIDYLLKPVTSALLQEAVLKAKQQLELNTINTRNQTGIAFQFLRMNIESLSDDALLHMLRLSGTKRYYWVAAFHHTCTLGEHPGEEITMLRNDEETVVAVFHSDDLPDDYGAYLSAHVSFDGSAGVGRPFERIRELPRAADEAIASLETSWFRRGVYLWCTDNEEQSVKFYLSRLEKKQSSAGISELLSALPTFLMEHRLNVRSVETIYNTLVAHMEARADGQPVHYHTWKDIRTKYRNADYLLTDLYRMLVPGADADTSSSSRAVVFRVMATLQRDYAQPIALQSMAARYHIDNSYLSSLFREVTGKTFTSYLTEIRVQHACEYLRSTTLTNAKIAQLCGFTTDSYLKKVFRKVLGMTPSQYRQMMTEKAAAKNGAAAEKKEEQP